MTHWANAGCRPHARESTVKSSGCRGLLSHRLKDAALGSASSGGKGVEGHLARALLGFSALEILPVLEHHPSPSLLTMVSAEMQAWSLGRKVEPCCPVCSLVHSGHSWIYRLAVAMLGSSPPEGLFWLCQACWGLCPPIHHHRLVSVQIEGRDR